MTSGENEAVIVSRLKAKDLRSFVDLYDRYSGALYGAILHIVGNTEDAALVLHQTFINVWKQIDTYNPSKRALFTWMLNIARSLSTDLIRRGLRSREDDYLQLR